MHRATSDLAAVLTVARLVATQLRGGGLHALSVHQSMPWTRLS